jgi:restriction endonuclease S subunit
MDFSWIVPTEIDDLLNPNYYREIYLEATRKVDAQEHASTLASVSKKISDGPFGSQLKTDEYLASGIPLFRVSDIQNLLVNLNDIVFISPEKQKQLSRSKVQPGDILITKAGRIGSSAVIPQHVNEANITSHLALIRLKSGIDAYFIAPFLESKYGRLLSERSSHKSTRPELTKSEVEKIPVFLPDPKIQAYIGDKVRLAEKCREESEIIKRSAQVLLDEILNLPSIDQLPQMQTNWWVDPEFAYSDRLDPNYYQPRFLRTEVILGPESSKFSEIVVNAKYGASVPADYKEEGIPFIRGTDLLQNRIDLSNLHYLDSSLAPKVKSAKVKAGDVLLTRSGTVGIAAAINEGLDNFAFGSFMIKLRFKESISPVYAAAFLNSPYGITQIERQKNGAVQQNINLEEIDRLLLPLLPTDQQKKISYLWAKWNLFLDYSQRLINQALSDIEKLIEGEMEIEEILLGKKKSLSWDDIEEEINGQLINYV